MLAWIRLYVVGVIVLVLQLFRRRKTNVKGRGRNDTTYIVSGTTSGIGKALCERLRKNSKVIELCVPGHGGVTADLRDLYALPALAERIRKEINATPSEQRQRVVLVHGAGVLHATPRDIYAVNLQAPAILSVLLADSVHRVVFLGSAAHIASSSQKPSFLAHPLYPKEAYPTSKRLLHPLAAVLSRYFQMRTTVIHPGVVNTALYTGEPIFMRFVLLLFGWTPQQSALRLCGLLPYDDAPTATYCDTTDMSQVNINLLTNSAECDLIWDELYQLVSVIKRKKQ